MGKWSQYKKMYRKEWESDPELKSWIAPVMTDESKARCKYCKLELRAHYHDLKTHAGRNKHCARCTPYTPSITAFTTASTGSGTISDDQKHREIITATYVATNTSINAVDEFGEILKEELGAFRMHRTKCTALINSLLGPYFKQQLLDDVGTSPYSLLVDESTDISVHKLLCICIKYYSCTSKKLVSTYLGMVELPQARAHDIAQAIVEFLNLSGLKTQNLTRYCCPQSNAKSS